MAIFSKNFILYFCTVIVNMVHYDLDEGCMRGCKGDKLCEARCSTQPRQQMVMAAKANKPKPGDISCKSACKGKRSCVRDCTKGTGGMTEEDAIKFLVGLQEVDASDQLALAEYFVSNGLGQFISDEVIEHGKGDIDVIVDELSDEFELSGTQEQILSTGTKAAYTYVVLDALAASGTALAGGASVASAPVLVPLAFVAAVGGALWYAGKGARENQNERYDLEPALV